MAGSKGFRMGSTTYLSAEDVPQKYKDEMDAIMSNVEAIHGADFVHHVKFRINLETMMSLLAQNTLLLEEVSKKEFEAAVSNIGSQLIASHAEARGLTPELDEAALKTAKALLSIVHTFEREVNEKRKR